MVTQEIEYDFSNEYILYSLSQLFKSNYSEEESFFKHSLDNLDYYRNIKYSHIEINEESLFIRIKINCTNCPRVKVIWNKENHKVCRVYVSNDEKKLGNSFYINDDKILELINLPGKVQKDIFLKVEQLKKEETANTWLITDSKIKYLEKLVSDKNQENKTDIKATLFPTFYGVCLILECSKPKQVKKRYRFLKDDFKNSTDLESKLQKVINNKINGFLRVVKPDKKENKNTQKNS